MTTSENRAQARQNIAGKWGKVALLTLIYGIISYAIAYVLEYFSFVGNIISIIISPVLAFGFLIVLFKINDNEDVGYVDFFIAGFSKFGKVWEVIGNSFIKIIFQLIIFIISSILLAMSIAYSNISLICIMTVIYIFSIIWFAIKCITYDLALYIIYDEPEMSGKEAVEKSAELMQGNIWNYICLNLSFIGWIIIAILPLGIGYLWLLPYMQITKINFYRNLSKNKSESH